jgi:hypothetical protein
VIGVLIFLAGIGVGVLAAIAAAALAFNRRYDSNPHRAPRAELPPATARQLRSFGRRNLADLRSALARRQYVPVERAGVVVRRGVSRASVPLQITGDFDQEPTR